MLSRTSRKRQHILVANVDRVLIVTSAAEPSIKPHLIDRYLVAAHQGNMRPLICINKADLDTTDAADTVAGRYRGIGYVALSTSVVNDRGLDQLRELLRNQTSVLVGPSGVGKTELALSVADLLFGGEKSLTTINMSEFQEAHTVSTLKGSPPGYVGYGEGGVLTEAVRRRPYSVILLDEVEKAHPDVLELFYQVFDKGMMEDGEGREIDFKNTIILLTSNACTDELVKLTADPETSPEPEALAGAIKPELNKIFKPAFLGRLLVIPYYPIRDEALKTIIRLKLGKIKRRLRENHKIDLLHDDALVDEVANRCTEVESGARNVDNILTNTLLPDIANQLLGHMAAGEELTSIRVSVGEDGAFVYE